MVVAGRGDLIGPALRIINPAENRHEPGFLMLCIAQDQIPVGQPTQPFIEPAVLLVQPATVRENVNVDEIRARLSGEIEGFGADMGELRTLVVYYLRGVSRL